MLTRSEQLAPSRSKSRRDMLARALNLKGPGFIFSTKKMATAEHSRLYAKLIFKYAPTRIKDAS